MNNNKNAYEILGVSREATDTEINQAFSRETKLHNMCKLHDRIRKSKGFFRLENKFESHLYPKEYIEKVLEEYPMKKEAHEDLNIGRSVVELEIMEKEEAERKRIEEEAKRNRAEEEAEKRRQAQREQEEKEQRIVEELEAERIKEKEELNSRQLTRIEDKTERLGNNLLDAYKEVRREEKAYSFTERHNRLYHKFDHDTYRSLPESIAVNIGRFGIHVFLETFYQLGKLSYIGKDSAPKYVIRNRKTIATAALLTGAILLGANSSNNDKVQIVEPPKVIKIVETPKLDESTAENVDGEAFFDGTAKPIIYKTDSNSRATTPEYDIDIDEDTIELMRIYCIEYGDTLSELAENAHITTNELKAFNGQESDKIYCKDVLEIPYTISKDDLKYYVKPCLVKSLDLDAIAKENQTTAETIHRLNKEAIEIIDGKYVILTDTIYVPKFITIHQYREVQRRNNEIVKTY